MDLSAFWGVSIMSTVVYGLIWALHNGGNGQTLRTIFLVIAIPASLLFLGVFYKMSLQDPNPPFLIHAAGVLGPVALFYYLFSRAIEADKQDVEKRNTEKLRVEALSPAERKREKEAKDRELKLQSDRQDSALYGAIVPTLVCPHCQTKGTVRRKTGASNEVVLTTSHTYKAKEETRMRCGNCNTDWKV